MNVLGSLPASDSKQFSLDMLDWQKILRFVLVQIAGLILSMVPVWLGYHYTFQGHDVTPEVVLIINTLAEAIRRWVSGSSSAPAANPGS